MQCTVVLNSLGAKAPPPPLSLMLLGLLDEYKGNYKVRDKSVCMIFSLACLCLPMILSHASHSNCKTATNQRGCLCVLPSRL